MTEAALVEQRVLERLALQQWSEGVVAQVVLVTVVEDRAEVALLLDDYEYWEYFTRNRDGGWQEAVSSSGPIVGWSDPTAIWWATNGG